MKRPDDAPGWREHSDRFAVTRPHFRRLRLIHDLGDVGATGAGVAGSKRTSGSPHGGPRGGTSMVSRFVSMALAFALAATVSFAAGEGESGEPEGVVVRGHRDRHHGAGGQHIVAARG